MSPIRIAVFASHRGSNFQALHNALRQLPGAPASVVLCISNNRRPGAFEFAESQGIETLCLSPTAYEDPVEYEADLIAALESRDIEVIVLAGYMRRLPEAVVRRWAGRIVNVHPALLPKHGGQGMYGMNVHQAVLAAGEKESGATVHLVEADYDTGPVLAQRVVPVLPGDTPETLAERVLRAEHSLLPEVVIQMTSTMANQADTRSRRAADRV